MNTDKKKWFLQLNWNFWIPISWEGWILYSVFILSIIMVYTFNEINDDVIFIFKDHWPILLELGIPINLFYWISRGRVKKR